MLKGLQSGFFKFFTSQRVLILAIFLLLCFVLTAYASGKTTYQPAKEGFDEHPGPKQGFKTEGSGKEEEDPTKSEGFHNMASSAGNVNSPGDLLPMNGNSELVGSFKSEEGVFPDNLLEAGSHQGLSTVSSSMRNANLQLRADPAIQKKSGCWWGESTIHADPNPIGLKV
jgi:hypothetical protein